MKLLIILLLTPLFAIEANAARYTPTIPGTKIPDPTVQSHVVCGEGAYYTLPNLSARDLSRAGHYPQESEKVPATSRGAGEAQRAAG